MALPCPQAMGTVGVFWGGLCSRAVHRVLPSCVCRMRQVACHVVDGKWRGVQAFFLENGIHVIVTGICIRAGTDEDINSNSNLQ